MKLAVAAAALLVHIWNLSAQTEFPDYTIKKLPAQYRCTYEAVSNGDKLVIWTSQPCQPFIAMEM